MATTVPTPVSRSAPGLSSDDAARRLVQFGPNTLASPPTRPRWVRFTDQFRSVLVLLLVGAAALAAALGDFKDAAVVAVVLLLNAALGYVQEGRAEGSMSALRAMLVATVRVRRDGDVQELATEDVVPGDVVLLEAGDRIPADGRFIVAARLMVDESSLTGESVPVDKREVVAGGDDVTDRSDRGFMNTTLVRGRAELEVAATGMSTEMGKVAGLINEADPGRTPLQVQLDRLGKRLALVAGAAVAVVLAISLLDGEPVGDAVLEAVALAVAAVPEGLPAVVTVTLAVGVHQMALRQAIVRRLASVETLGSTTVICSDKTGTLTLNEMVAREVIVADTRLTVSEAIDVDEPVDADVLCDALAGGVLCNDAALFDGEIVGDPTEGALVVLGDKAGIDVDGLRAGLPRVAELPFEAGTKWMATMHRDRDDVAVYVKGAPDVVVQRCTTVRTPRGEAPLDDAGRARWTDRNESLARQGMRVLALASRRLPAGSAIGPHGAVADPDEWTHGLRLDALVGIVDPPRAEARDAIERCHRAGIAVKMITGDHAVTAGAIARELGIEGRVVNGAELDSMSDEDLSEEIDGIGVCARVSPTHKVRVVRALRSRGHVVAMTGDGVNDAAALKSADIGVAMGITGTEVTKEAADMVLADDNFATITRAVERGRAIHDNIVKFVRFQLTTNLGAIGTIVGASIVGLPAPLTAIQVLFVNLIADGPPAMTLGVDPPGPGVMSRPPREPGAPILDRRRLARLLLAAVVMTVGTLAVLAYGRDTWGDDVGLTMAFTTFVLFQLANVFNARTERASLFRRASLTNGKLWGVVGAVAALQVLIVTVTPMQRIFDTTSLTLGQWALCVVVASAVVLSEEARKVVDRVYGVPLVL